LPILGKGHLHGMNIIDDPVFTVNGGEQLSLSALFAGLTRGEVRGFAALRPHQRPAWHMFLVQLAALALWTAGRRGLADDVADWAALLRGLTPDHADDAPWLLVSADTARPAFLQPPSPEGLNWRPVETPDALDLLITARNHDLKQAVARKATAEEWVLALVSLQTSEGYGGSKNYGIARMNGGSSSRPMLGLAPTRPNDQSIDPATWWARDVLNLLSAREAGQEGGVGAPGGAALLWCLDWPEAQQLDLRDLDPWFIEVCRRVRLACDNGTVTAVRAGSKAERINAKAFKGNVGDPWIPVHKSDGKAFTLGGADFTYKLLNTLLFSGDWAVPLLAQPRPGDADDMLLVAEALSRGNSKTEGFKSRVVPVPGDALAFLATETSSTLAKIQIEEIAGFDKALRNSLALMAAGGDRDAVKKDHYGLTLSARSRFDRVADRLFFPSLWHRLSVFSVGDREATDAKKAFLVDLHRAAQAELNSALLAIPCAVIRRPRAKARARQAFYFSVRKSYPELFRQEDADVAA
jgi:CRISPR system Cascade subunit CasA